MALNLRFIWFRKKYRKDKGVATVREFYLSGEEKFLRIVIMS